MNYNELDFGANAESVEYVLRPVRNDRGQQTDIHHAQRREANGRAKTPRERIRGQGPDYQPAVRTIVVNNG